MKVNFGDDLIVDLISSRTNPDRSFLRALEMNYGGLEVPSLLSGTNALSSQLLRLAAQDTFPSGQRRDSYILWVRWLTYYHPLPASGKSNMVKLVIWLNSNWKAPRLKSVALVDGTFARTDKIVAIARYCFRSVTAIATH